MLLECPANAPHYDLFKCVYRFAITLLTYGKQQMAQNKAKVLNIVNKTLCLTPAANDLITGTEWLPYCEVVNVFAGLRVVYKPANLSDYFSRHFAGFG